MWQAADSLLVLRDQVDIIAPDRSKGSDGLVCDENHPTSSDHCPHFVEGIGRDVVTALDLTHDPKNGFDSYEFAETLRVHRDKRIKYVISNHRMFSSYATSSSPAWTWRPYTGSDDPHTGHVHISVLDDPISASRMPWNLEGFDDMEQTDKLAYQTDNANRTVGQVYADLENLRNWEVALEGTPLGPGGAPAGSRVALLYDRVAKLSGWAADMQEQLDRIEAKIDSLDPGSPVPPGAAGTFTGTWATNA